MKMYEDFMLQHPWTFDYFLIEVNWGEIAKPIRNIWAKVKNRGFQKQLLLCFYHCFQFILIYKWLNALHCIVLNQILTYKKFMRTRTNVFFDIVLMISDLNFRTYINISSTYISCTLVISKFCPFQVHPTVSHKTYDVYSDYRWFTANHLQL